MSDLTAEGTARLVRGALKRAFPGTEFSVRADVYDGGSSVHVLWTDGPEAGAVDKVVQPYAGAVYDILTETKTPVDRWAGGGADYVFTERLLSSGSLI